MDRIAAFDTLYTNNHVQICKLLLPLVPKDKQYYLAIFIKFLELQHTIKYGQKLQYTDESLNSQTGNSPDYQTLCQEVLPYCTTEEQKLVSTILNLLKTMDTFQSIKPLLEMIGQFQGNGDGENGSGSGFDFSSLLSMGDLFSSGDFSSMGDLSAMADLFQGNGDFLNNLKDFMPDTGNDFFGQENKDRSKQDA